MVSASLDLLEDSLKKKIDIMKLIELENEKQRDLLKNFDKVDDAAFEAILDIKGDYIEQLISLDDGFQSLFDRVKEEIGKHKDQHAEQIRRMQELIQEITGLSASIEAAEQRNKKLAEEYFSCTRQKMNYSRQASAAAFNYYQTMNNFKNVPPQFIDDKN